MVYVSIPRLNLFYLSARNALKKWTAKGNALGRFGEIFRACIKNSATDTDLAVAGSFANLFMILGDINMIGFFPTPITRHENRLLLTLAALSPRFDPLDLKRIW